MKESTIIYKNTEIHYTSQGFGKPLVLLHGFLESVNIWDYLSLEFSMYRQVICIDLPGHGKSGCFEEVHSMEEMAEAVHVVLQELKVEQADFLGHSMGGYVSLAYLEKYPEMVRKIILLNSSPRADSEERKTNRDRAVALVQENKKAFVNMAISNLLTPENNKKFKSELEILKTEALQFPTQGITAALEGMKIRTDRSALLKQFKGDKFILAGKEDPILEYQEIKELAEELNCRFYSFPDGHLSIIENKEELIKVLHFIE